MSGIRMDVNQVLRQMTQLEQRTLSACVAYGQAAANKMVKTAKQTRPWTDRTHLAKNSLNGGAGKVGAGRVRIELAHGVHYGVYLELKRFRHKGTLAIVFPTVEKMAPEIIRGWSGVVRKGGG